MTLLVVIGHVITLVYCIYFQPEDEVSYFETLHLTTRVLFRYEIHSPDNSSKIHIIYTQSNICDILTMNNITGD